ncbi:MAG: CpsB/CapC family capsule biosynthesis tyrosine phosphatase, partial [Chloroflexota bacterium]
MIDLHNHILPGVDDGATSIEQSRAMARACLSYGLTVVCATPHTTEWSTAGDAQRIGERVVELRTDFQREGIELELLAGA